MSDTTAALTAEQQAAYDKGVTLLNEGKAEEASEVLSALLEAAYGCFSRAYVLVGRLCTSSPQDGHA